MRWLFPGKEVRIDAHCLDCAEPLTIRMQDEAILEVTPESAVAQMSIPIRRWQELSWAFR